MKVSNPQINQSNMFDRASQYGDSQTLNRTVQNKGSNAQIINPDAVRPLVEKETLDPQQGTQGAIDRKVGTQRRGRSGPGVQQQAPQERARSVEQAQDALTNQADALSVNARQFQAFLTGGNPSQTRTNWSNMHAGTNITRQLFQSQIALRFRG